MKLCFSFALLFIVLQLTAQSKVFIPPVEAGEIAFENGDYRTALRHYHLALKQERGTPLDWLKGAAAAAALNRKNDAREMIDRALVIGYLDALEVYDSHREFDDFRYGLMNTLLEERLDVLLHKYPVSTVALYPPQNNLEMTYVNGGNYLILVHYGHRAQLRQNYRLAFSIFRRAFQYGEASVRTQLRAGASAAWIGERDWANELLRSAFSRAPSAALNCVRTDPIIVKALTELPSFASMVGERILHHFPGLDQVLVSELDDIWGDYLKYRSPGAGETGSSNPGVHYLEPIRADWRAAQASLDELCVRRMTNIFDHVGYPPAPLVADRSILPLLLLRAAPMRVWEEYHDMLMDAVREGTITARDYAVSYDYARVRNGLPQSFGTLIERDPVLGARLHAQNWPVEDIPGLDERRSAIGLPPIRERHKLSGMYGDIAERMNRGSLPAMGEIPTVLTAPYPNYPR